MSNVLEGWANIDRKEVTPIEDIQPASRMSEKALTHCLGSQAKGGEALRGSKFHHTVYSA